MKRRKATIAPQSSWARSMRSRSDFVDLTAILDVGSIAVKEPWGVWNLVTTLNGCSARAVEVFGAHAVGVDFAAVTVNWGDAAIIPH